MRTTPFAGLTQLDPDESLATNNASFQSNDPEIVDHFLQVGAVTHRHDEHAALSDPIVAPSATVSSAGGTIGADEVMTLGYTLLDADGGETMISPPTVVSTDAPLEGPTSEIDGSVTYDGGDLLSGTYYYCITLLDGAGGETVAGPDVQVTREPGFASATVTLANLAADLETGAMGWRLFRAKAGFGFVLLASGTEDTFVDDGTIPGDPAQEPPTFATATAFGTNSVTVNVPSAGVGEAESFCLYLTPDGDFNGGTLVGTYPAASAGQDIVITALDLAPGSPPEVNLSKPGANKIDPDTELIDWHWKRPVSTASALPAVGNEPGDVRVTEDDGAFHVWVASASTWVGVEGGSGSGGGGGGGGVAIGDLVYGQDEVGWFSSGSEPLAHIYTEDQLGASGVVFHDNLPDPSVDDVWRRLDGAANITDVLDTAFEFDDLEGTTVRFMNVVGAGYVLITPKSNDAINSGEPEVSHRDPMEEEVYYVLKFKVRDATNLGNVGIGLSPLSMDFFGNTVVLSDERVEARINSSAGPAGALELVHTLSPEAADAANTFWGDTLTPGETLWASAAPDPWAVGHYWLVLHRTATPDSFGGVQYGYTAELWTGDPASGGSPDVSVTHAVSPVAHTDIGLTGPAIATFAVDGPASSAAQESFGFRDWRILAHPAVQALMMQVGHLDGTTGEPSNIRKLLDSKGGTDFGANYDDSELRGRIEILESEVSGLSGGGDSVIRKVLTADVGPISNETNFDNFISAFHVNDIGALTSEIWLFKLSLFVSTANATMGLKLRMNLPSGSTKRWGQAGQATTTGDLTMTLASGIAIVSVVGVAFGGGTSFQGLNMLYAQNLSDPGNLSILKGSTLEIVQVN